VVEQAYQVAIASRGAQLWVISTGGEVAPANRALLALYGLIERGHSLQVADVRHAVQLLQHDPTADLNAYFSNTVLAPYGSRPIVPRTVGQRRYVAAMRASEVVFGVGPAGTGKTYLAAAMAVAELKKGNVKRLILTRPAVEAGEKLGFLPGDLSEKVDPYVRPLFDALQVMLPGERMEQLIERRIIEVAPLAYMRGRTLSDAVVLLDEAQNTTIAQMRMFLTRLGEGSRMIVNGDVTQVDLPRGQQSGLVHAVQVLEGVPGIEVVRFDSSDVIRHALVARVIDAYDRHARQHHGERDT